MRKRDQYPDPAKRIVINEAVCEGCGDCSVQSNCLSVEPLETDFGRKRQINQSSCNKDYSCVKGYCPSFVTVIGGKLKPQQTAGALAGEKTSLSAFTLPQPAIPPIDTSFGILVTGIGGTGVVTIGQIIAMAAHVEGKGCSVLDMSGLAQKGGPVLSHVRIANQPEDLHSTRISTGATNLVIGCDLAVTASLEALTRMGDGRTRAVINSTAVPTAAFVANPDWEFPTESAINAVRAACSGMPVDLIDAGRIASALMGDAIAANMFMLGYAWQKGWVPLSDTVLLKAIELNGISVAFNQQAFGWGRAAAHDPAKVERLATPAHPIVLHRKLSIDELIAQRVAFLTDYQDATYAAKYRAFVDEVRSVEATRTNGSTRLTEAVARYYFKLMAGKDEYEVARLHSNGDFLARIADIFEGDYKLRYNLAPPLFARTGADGLPIKSEYGSWVRHAFGLLAKLRFLRGTVFDIFAFTEERKAERALAGEYRVLISSLLRKLTAANLPTIIAIASIPEDIRGYGHVRLQHLKDAREKEKRLLAALDG